MPNPDETLASRSGICFDYASLAAAMLRSLGIPCQVITGYVGPESLYHAWNMVYIDGSWVGVAISRTPSGNTSLLKLFERFPVTNAAMEKLAI